MLSAKWRPFYPGADELNICVIDDWSHETEFNHLDEDILRRGRLYSIIDIYE